jgi:HEAT repeat protein
MRKEEGIEIDAGLCCMIADYMEKGFLENIIDMVVHDNRLISLVGDLIQDERIRVRIGATALVEELARRKDVDAGPALPALLPLLNHPEAVVRGDAANLLGIIGHASALPVLQEALHDSDPQVRLLAEEAMAEIREAGKSSGT